MWHGCLFDVRPRFSRRLSSEFDAINHNYVLYMATFWYIRPASCQRSSQKNSFAILFEQVNVLHFLIWVQHLFLHFTCTRFVKSIAVVMSIELIDCSPFASFPDTKIVFFWNIELESFSSTKCMKPTSKNFPFWIFLDRSKMIHPILNKYINL